MQRQYLNSVNTCRFSEKKLDKAEAHVHNHSLVFRKTNFRNLVKNSKIDDFITRTRISILLKMAKISVNFFRLQQQQILLFYVLSTHAISD